MQSETKRVPIVNQTTALSPATHVLDQTGVINSQTKEQWCWKSYKNSVVSIRERQIGIIFPSVQSRLQVFLLLEKLTKNLHTICGTLVETAIEIALSL